MMGILVWRKVTRLNNRFCFVGGFREGLSSAFSTRSRSIRPKRTLSKHRSLFIRHRFPCKPATQSWDHRMFLSDRTGFQDILIEISRLIIE